MGCKTLNANNKPNYRHDNVHLWLDTSNKSYKATAMYVGQRLPDIV